MHPEELIAAVLFASILLAGASRSAALCAEQVDA